MSDIIFALVQYQIISFLHCYFLEANFVFFFLLKLPKSENDKLRPTFRPGMKSLARLHEVHRAIVVTSVVRVYVYVYVYVCVRVRVRVTLSVKVF